MGMFLNQNEERTELQQRIAADLRAKAEAKSKIESDRPDGVDDSAYIEGTKQTTSLAWVWLLLFFAVIGIFIFVASKLSA